MQIKVIKVRIKRRPLCSFRWALNPRRVLTGTEKDPRRYKDDGHVKTEIMGHREPRTASSHLDAV